VDARRTTITDVARVAGVSRGTASRVINDEPGVARDVRERVRQVIDELGYRPNPAARALASGRTDVVDLVVSDACSATFGVNPYYGRVVAGILSGLAGTSAHMRLHLVAGPDVPGLLASLARTADLGAVLVNVPETMVAEAYQHTDRLVCMHSSAPRVPYVDTQNEAGARAAVAHLVGRGRRRIAGIHGPETHPCAAQRHNGYLGAMREAGLGPLTGSGDFRRDVGHREASRLLTDHPDIDALFVACDLMAVGALQALAEMGRRVPDDVAVVGFDDSLLAASAIPPMSSVRQPVEDMAAAATRALLGRVLTPHWRQVLPADLVVRASSG
jgi:DNA-binding LacI/PurR family transcriptional regulator